MFDKSEGFYYETLDILIVSAYYIRHIGIAGSGAFEKSVGSIIEGQVMTTTSRYLAVQKAVNPNSYVNDNIKFVYSLR